MRKFAALFCAALALVTSRAVASDLVSVGENGVLSAVHIRNRQAALFTGQFAFRVVASHRTRQNPLSVA